MMGPLSRRASPNCGGLAPCLTHLRCRGVGFLQGTAESTGGSSMSSSGVSSAAAPPPAGEGSASAPAAPHQAAGAEAGGAGGGGGAAPLKVSVPGDPQVTAEVCSGQNPSIDDYTEVQLARSTDSGSIEPSL